MLQIKKINEYQYEIPMTGNMKVPGTIYINDDLLRNFTDDEPLKQVMHVASLPGIVKSSMAMPDIHLGYGFPIGGVAAFDYDTGIISPGGVGYDINCGVSLIVTDIDYGEAKDKIRALLDEIYKSVPAGIDNKSSFQITTEDENEIMFSERGIRTFEQSTRFTLDISAIPVLHEKTEYPVIIDPSHPAGVNRYVEPLALGGPAAGADGLMIEVHPDPSKALSDSAQQLTVPQFRNLYTKVRDINAVLGKTMM